MNRLFYYQNSYARLSGDELVSMTPAEVENFCRINRNTTLVAFIHPDEARNLPRFWTQTDLRIKQVRLDENFRSTVLAAMDRELSGCYELVKSWLLGIDPALISFTAQIPS
jgi:hypothetical protein